MSEMIEALRRHPFAESLELPHLERLERCGDSLLTFEPGSHIFREGRPADACYLLDHGDVGLEISVPGSGNRTIQTLHGGEVLGWSWLFSPYEWSFDAKAYSFTQAVSLDAKRLLAERDADRDFGYALMTRFAEIIVDRLQATRLQLLDVYASHH